jgi:acyl-CoA reductase-like NAD-dependent aldehyde dehydrogenase
MSGRRLHVRDDLSTKRLAGAKNSMIVMPDAVLEKAVPNIISSAYGNAGERCLAGSVLVTVGEAGDRVVEVVKEAAENMKVGPGYVIKSASGRTLLQLAAGQVRTTHPVGPTR